MAFATIQFFSQSLQKATALNVVFPDDPAIARPWSTFYLLHGMSDDHTIWTRRTSIERYAEGLPLVVAMPDGGRGWYTDAPGGPAHERDLIEDVVGLVDRLFPVRASRAGRAIGGLSMGGYGALKAALKHPDLFASATSHSGALGATRDSEVARTFSPEYDLVFGPSPATGPEDLFLLAERLDRTRMPAMRIDCGLDDFLLEQNRTFHRHLRSLGVPHEYEEPAGGHDWAYWDARVREALVFHSRILNL